MDLNIQWYCWIWFLSRATSCFTLCKTPLLYKFFVQTVVAFGCKIIPCIVMLAVVVDWGRVEYIQFSHKTCWSFLCTGPLWVHMLWSSYCWRPVRWAQITWLFFWYCRIGIFFMMQIGFSAPQGCGKTTLVFALDYLFRITGR